MSLIAGTALYDRQVLHCPSPISSKRPPFAVALGARAASAARLVIYAGAGIGLSQPTGLPTGRTLSSRIHARLKSAFPVLEQVDEWDLLAVADAVEALPDGEDALRQTAALAANFNTAKPGYAHRVLALLMLEGAIDVLTTNWDTCIERAANEESLPTVTNQADLLAVTPPWVLKVHGCATRPASLLISTAHLANPPTWVKNETHARLGSAVVVFIGIGDVADYVKQRIVEAIEEAGPIENIRVVTPDIQSNWANLQWKDVAPDLHEEHKVAATADEFMEHLAAEYVVCQLDQHAVALSPEVSLASALGAARKGLFESDALSVLRWARSLDINPRPGEPVLKNSNAGIALTALGHLAGESARLQADNTFMTEEGAIELLIASQAVPSRHLVQAAENRAQDHANRGSDAPAFIVAGGVGPIPRPVSLPESIIGESDERDILDGPLALVVDIRDAQEVLAS